MLKPEHPGVPGGIQNDSEVFAGFIRSMLNQIRTLNAFNGVASFFEMYRHVCLCNAVATFAGASSRLELPTDDVDRPPCKFTEKLSVATDLCFQYCAKREFVCTCWALHGTTFIPRSLQLRSTLASCSMFPWLCQSHAPREPQPSLTTFWNAEI